MTVPGDEPGTVDARRAMLLISAPEKATSRRRRSETPDRDSNQLRGEGRRMAHQYRCEKCGHVSDRPGSCCGQPMKETS